MQKDNLVNIRQIVKKYKVSPFTVNHYTDIGLLNVVSKRKNARLYDDTEVRGRLKLIAELKDKGYPLRLIRMELSKGKK